MRPVLSLQVEPSIHCIKEIPHSDDRPQNRGEPFCNVCRQTGTHVSFIGAFVLAEPNVSVNLKQAFINFGNGIDLRGNLPELFAHLNHKFPGRVQYMFFVIIAVFFEPFL